MRRTLKLLGLIAALASACVPDVPDVPVLPDDTVPPGARVLWVGAHPDDELYAAPLFGAACVDDGGSCTFLVLTRGEGGKCGLRDGCEPDVATVRDGELRTSAALFDAALDHRDLGNVAAASPEQAFEQWAERVGGQEALVSSMIETITATAPDVIVTFDPRHGTSCHPDHRAAAGLVLFAVDEMGDAAPPVLLIGNREYANELTGVFGFIPAVDDDPTIRAWDATRELESVDDQAWKYLSLVLGAHPSQFSEKARNAADNAPEQLRRVYLIDVDEAREVDPGGYDELCR